MPSREEFARRLEAARREENRVGLVWIACFFAAIFAQIPLYMWTASMESPLLAVAFLVEVAVLIGGNVWLIVWYFKNRPRRFGLLCPTCGAALHGFAGEVVLASNRCPLCKAAVWGE